MSIEAAIAINRFGLGAKGGQTLPSDPKKWLLGQLDAFDASPSAIASQPSATALATSYRSFVEEARALRKAKKAGMKEDGQAKMAKNKKMARKGLRDYYLDASNARLSAALETRNDFAERLVHFWSNHFAVSIEKPLIITFAGDYEFSAIRPNIMGRFSDLLTAATQHPAMLLYLDQAQSIGPNSAIALLANSRRRRKFGLNENLAREILELHTLGVRTGYGQGDVTEFARALTGWTVAGLTRGPVQRRLENLAKPGEAIFWEPIHEPGARRLLGQSYDQKGKAQAAAILSDIATHPATAKHIATKLARHFVSDNPPASLVKKLERNFLKTGGDLSSLYRTLIEAPEVWPAVWNADQAKFKSPWDWVVSSLRALGVSSLPGSGNVAGAFRQLGHPVWRPESPAGFADTTQTWAGGAALLRRYEVASRIARRSANQVDARILAPQILPGILGENTIQGIARAESQMQGLSLLLISPEFLRR